MDFELTRRQVRCRRRARVCAGRFPIETVRALGRAAASTATVERAGRHGRVLLRLPEAAGGVGLGWADAVLVFEELGRALVPGPLVWTHLAAGLVDGAADRRRIVGGIERATRRMLSSTSTRSIVLLVLDDDGAWRVSIRDLEVEPVATSARSADPGAAGWPVRCPQGEQVARRRGVAELRDARRGARSATRCSAWPGRHRPRRGLRQGALQFDRPIGAFQAVKHLLADMVTRAEVARAAVYAAGVTLDEPGVGSVEPGGGGGQAHGGRGRRGQRQERHPGARRHGLHVGGRRPPVLQAGVRARAVVRLARGVRRQAWPTSSRPPSPSSSRRPPTEIGASDTDLGARLPGAEWARGAVDGNDPAGEVSSSTVRSVGKAILFHQWLRMAPNCPRCGLHFQRVPGHWLGSWFLNICLVQTVVVLILIVGVAVTYPTPPMVALRVVENIRYVSHTVPVLPFITHNLPCVRSIWPCARWSSTMAWRPASSSRPRSTRCVTTIRGTARRRVTGMTRSAA